LRAEEREKYSALKKLRDDHFSAKRAYRTYQDEAWAARKEREKKEREEWDSAKRRKDADRKLEEASEPAYGVEIGTAESLIRFFDPSSVVLKEKAGPGEFAASVGRTVDEDAFKGMKVAKKDEEDYFIGGGGKKKKGKKGGKTESPAGSAPTESTGGVGKVQLSYKVIEDLGHIGVDPPSTQADVPGVIEKIKEKIAKWKAGQDSKTKEVQSHEIQPEEYHLLSIQNIAKAKKEIDRLEAEAAKSNIDAAPTTTSSTRSRDDAKKSAQANAGVNGKVSADAELKQEKDAVADVSEELKATKIEDATA
jgi:uncharacterized small protein (DUF1192 family)